MSSTIMTNTGGQDWEWHADPTLGGANTVSVSNSYVNTSNCWYPYPWGWYPPSWPTVTYTTIYPYKAELSEQEIDALADKIIARVEAKLIAAVAPKEKRRGRSR